ncbi:Indoleamine 2,3-dioxygenase [Pholiota conissans]|uniref:Indoleamine 2,3-dioxygenase n=1 Tax=Pholiota conissans TaxID=109636 RepID=A0A9P5YUR8_9AGAR|nr:Indoleamine 2,3-dioxygenase [Pholiota conissans]
MSTPLQHLKSSAQTSQVFDVDPHSGFMAPEPPISRLPEKWEAWEIVLDNARAAKLQLGDKVGLATSEASISASWRKEVRKMPELSIVGLEESVILLRRAHLVLAYILHFYVQSLPPSEAVSIPPSISIPILRLSAKLDLPPVLTFSDTVLYNWNYKFGPQNNDQTPDINNIRIQTTFTGLVDEEEFYLCSARIELRGVEILELMRMTMDETFVGDAIAVRRISGYLHTISSTIDELKKLLLDVKTKCNPDVYYNQVRPWFRGEDSDENKRSWVFEGVGPGGDPELHVPKELSGPSAGQSSMIHILDIFFGVDHQASSPGKPPFMVRMQSYMPRNHRLFLDHLKANPRPLRVFVADAKDADLLAAYNVAVLALKTFRDAHMIIAALYILGPARRAKAFGVTSDGAVEGVDATKVPLKGTGGTDLVKFLKDTRTRTTETIIPGLGL